jgi:hypothetical protein
MESSESEVSMTEKTTKRTPMEDLIPEEVHQHARAAHEEISAGLRSFLPPEALEHGRKARKEILLTWRSMIDAAIDRIEAK